MISIISYAKENRVKTFFILPENTNISLEYLQLGIDDFVFNTDAEINIEYRILKLLNFTKPIEIDIQKYEYITYVITSREIYIKGSKIQLTTFESIFISYLISNKGYCNMQDFEKYLYGIFNRKIPKKSIVVGISRFKRKVYISTGYVIIKSRYGLGYVINS